MISNPIPKVAIGWGISDLHRKAADLKAEVSALQVPLSTNDLSEPIGQAYHVVVDVVHLLESSVSQLKLAAQQEGVPLEDL